MSSQKADAILDRAAAYPQRRVERENAFDAWATGLWGRVRHSLPGAWWMRSTAVRSALALKDETAALDDRAIRSGLRTHARLLAHDATAMAHALALVGEAARRSLGLRPHPEQLLGAALLLQGKLAEMQTGEGKTLTAGLAATIAACAGAPVHVITVNDYLAERDGAKLSPLYGFFGLSVGSVLSPMNLDDRRKAYACDIAYCTGKELVFDYLKDQVGESGGTSADQRVVNSWIETGARARSALLLRGLHFAIVDEADSIFIDEARTPLILSQRAGPNGDVALYETAIALARQLEKGPHYRIRPAARELELTEHGRSVIAERCLALGPAWKARLAREHHVAQALRALHLFRRNQHYVVKDDKVLIVDEQTGRVLPGRTWEQGLHQMIEVKEGMGLSDQVLTVARITYQRFFRRYLHLAGMTGTAREVRQELFEVYGLQTVIVPTNRPCQRRIETVHCAATEEEKWQLVCARVAQLIEAGRPVLVGTRSVAASQVLSVALTERGIFHQVLNALQDANEAALIGAAGLAGAVTVATNMAGRGTDIELGPRVAKQGGLHVILTEFHESRRVDRQLFGRAARQGDPGSAQAIVSLDDDLIAGHAPALRGVWHLLPPGGLRSAWVGLLRRHCQNAAEIQNARQRRAAMRHDTSIEDMLSFSGKT